MRPNLTNITVLLVLVSIISNEALAQKAPKKPVVDDTVRTTPFASRDTIETKPVFSRLYWYDLENKLLIPRDSSRHQIFRLPDESSLIYTNFSDMFWNNPLWFVYDLNERGRPSFISMLNKYPHQSSIYFNKVIMNDVIHGMYDLQYLAINHTHSSEASIIHGSIQNFSTHAGEVFNINSNTRHTKAPWTKILYKQGSFGYSNLDISFVLPFSETVALQLGGFNNIYDGSMINTDFQGYNFRGQLTWQYNNNLYIRGQFYLNRTEVGLTPYDFTQEIIHPRHDEHRDDFLLDVTWLPDDTLSQRLHLMVYSAATSRLFFDRDNRSYRMNNRSSRYGFDANYNFFIGRMELKLGGGAVYPEVWGDAFKKMYHPYLVNTYADLLVPFGEILNFYGSMQLAYQNDFDIQWSPSVRLNLKPSKKHEIDLAAYRQIRFPNSTERFFDFDSIYGNANVQSEAHITFCGSYQFNARSNWQLGGTIGYCRVDKEIQWNSMRFRNSNLRDFTFATLNTSYSFWQIDLSLGGHYTISHNHYTPRSSIWSGAHFYYQIIKNTLKLDAYGTVCYYNKHDKINFESRLLRFYKAVKGENDGYFTLNWKVVATLSDAQIFLEMNNALSNQYEVINGYPEFYYRFRFGLNWELWD